MTTQVQHGGRREGAGRPPEVTKTKRLVITMTEEMHEWLEAAAAQSGLSMAQIVRQAVQKYQQRF